MFQYFDNDVNSYNSLSLNQTRKAEFKSPKTYLSTKIILSNELSSTIKHNQINQNKNIIFEINNPNINILKTDREDNKNNLIENSSNRNEQNEISQKNLNFDSNMNENDKKNKANISLTKLPKITKYSIQTSSDLSNNNPMKSISNSIDKTIIHNQNFYYTKHQIFSNDRAKGKNSNKKRKNSLRLSGKVNIESIHSHLNEKSKKHINNNNIIIKSINKNSNNIIIYNNNNIINNINNNIYNNINNDTNNNIINNINYNTNKKNKVKNEPKLGKMKEYIKLPEFIGEEPLTEMIFNPIFEENLMKPHNEKQYEINLYLNSNKMINNLIYLKIPISKDGSIPTQNIVNVKKLNKENKFEEDEEELLPDNKNEIIKNEIVKNEKITQEEYTPVIIPKKETYESISEYPGNYKLKKDIQEREKELLLSQKMNKKHINRFDSSDINEQLQNTKFPINLNYKINRRNKNIGGLFREKNSEKYISKSINSQMGNNFFDNNSDKSYNSINNNDDMNTNQDNKEESALSNTLYGGIEPYYKLKNENDNTLIFESRFESGNLLCAFKTEEENKYILYLQNDTNTTGYIQWFFFRVSNTKKGKKATFTIINMLRKTCVYKKGLKIMVYSKKQAKEENIGWHRDCENVIYYTNNLFTYNDNSKKKRSLSSLTFEYEFKYDNDTVYFANCLPYFYSKLTKEIDYYEKNKNNNFIFTKNSITQTLGGNDLMLLNITSNKNQGEISFPQLNNGCNQPFANSSNSLKLKNNEFNNQTKLNNSKKAVIMIARQHPGETVGSHVIKGCIDFLLGDSEEAEKLREIYNFQIIPMMNPDGVLVGNSRTGFAGCDLNRRWAKPNEIIHPEIFYTKSMILNTALKQNISFVIDFHGHFGAYNSLFYCNHKEEKEICSLFPYLCSKLSNIISFEQSTFSMPKYKNSTERLSLFRELEGNDNNNIVALETSFFGTKNNRNDEKNYYFNTKLLNEIGRDVCLGMLSYYIKYEKISIENVTFLSDKEKIKKLDVDMREFESDLIREVNEDEDQEGEDELSESEPSIDNFDKKEIMRLMPVPQKKKKKKGKNNNNGNHTNNFRLKKFEKYISKKKYGTEKNNLEKNKNNVEDDIELYNPLKELRIRKIEEENNKKLTMGKNSSPAKQSSINNLNSNQKSKTSLEIKKSQQQQPTNLPAPIPTEPNTKNDYSQTEEIFFRMHWSFFVGKYKILTGKRTNNNLPNISGFPLNLIGKLNNNYINNITKRNEILVNGRIKNINWTKFTNILADEKSINQIKKQNENSHFKIKKINDGDTKSGFASLKDKTNLKNIYYARLNGTNHSLKKPNNNGLKGSSKELMNKEKNSNDNNGKK